jgi:hypothetical protein
MSQRRFPPPWSVEETAACFIVRDLHPHRSKRPISCPIFSAMPSNVAVRRIAGFFARSPRRCVRSIAISVSVAPVSGQFYVVSESTADVSAR